MPYVTYSFGRSVAYDVRSNPRMHRKPPRNATTLQPNLSLRPLVIGPKRYMTPTLTEPTHAVVENFKKSKNM